MLGILNTSLSDYSYSLARSVFLAGVVYSYVFVFVLLCRLVIRVRQRAPILQPAAPTLRIHVVDDVLRFSCEVGPHVVYRDV